jgi:site-specific recombinase XerD
MVKNVCYIYSNKKQRHIKPYRIVLKKNREALKMIGQKLNEFLNDMKLNELSQRTIDKYETDIKAFLEWANIKAIEEVKKELLIKYKEHLNQSLKVSSLNNKITIINKFISYLGLGSDFKLKQMKVQRKTSLEDVLSVSDYERMLRMAQKLNKIKMYYLMKTLAGTGIRIDELQHITVEAAKKGVARVNNKGKIRDIIITKKLSKELKEYCAQEGITEGIIFISKFGNVIDKAYIHRELKYIAGQARIKKDKAHAHSFRHLFAKEFISKNNNIVLLADILGHSSLETTRIYTKKSVSEQRDILDGIL